MTEELRALKKYGVFVLTPQRRQLLGRTLIDLEKRKISLDEAKKNLTGSILFSKSILNALEKAGKKKR